MPVNEHRITAEDIIPDAEFARVRAERRAELLPRKRLRRIDLGPVCTVYFESYETMLFQIQEMLLVEGGGAEQLKDELAAYNPMVPQGSELTATIMFEIDDPVRRDAMLRRLGGVDDHFFLQVGDEKIAATPEGDVERTSAEGKASSVHFVHFPLTEDQKAKFNEPGVTIMVGCDHEQYAHLALLSPATRLELSKDFSQ